MLSYLFLLSLLDMRECGFLFQSTRNISKSSFSASKKKSAQTESSLGCAQLCLHYHTNTGTCNSYSYQAQSLQCDLASLTFLEDPLEDFSDGGEEVVMVEVEAMESLPRLCRGGEHCCRADQPCALGSLLILPEIISSNLKNF